MNILIIGTGAVGCAMAASFASERHAVSVLAHSQTADYIRQYGVMRTGLFGEIRILPDQITVYETYEEIQGNFDDILVCTKAMVNPSIAEALSKHPSLLHQDSKIVLFQNGWGNDDAFLTYFPKDMIYNARVITGFERSKPGVSRVTVHTAPILLGSLFHAENACMEPLAAAIADSGIPSEVSGEIGKALWAKMLFNTTLNPLGAILNMTYGQLSESEQLREIMDHLIDETFAVMESCGYQTFWETPQEYKEVFYGKLVVDTYQHRSSTLQDLEKKQPTEIDTLNGCIVALAKKHRIEVPYHEMICNMIKGIEQQRNKIV